MGVGGTKVLVDTQRLGRHRQAPQERLRTPVRRRGVRLAAMIAAAGVAMAIVAAFVVYSVVASGTSWAFLHQQRHGLPTTPGSYIGLYSHGVPDSYAAVKAFTTAPE